MTWRIVQHELELILSLGLFWRLWRWALPRDPDAEFARNHPGVTADAIAAVDEVADAYRRRFSYPPPGTVQNPSDPSPRVRRLIDAGARQQDRDAELRARAEGDQQR